MKKALIFTTLSIILVIGVIYAYSSNKDNNEPSEPDINNEEPIKNSDDEDEDLKADKYYLSSNLERYKAYMELHSDYSIRKIVSSVNCNIDNPYYSNIQNTDTSKGYLMIVNKYYKLSENYRNPNMVAMNLKYSYTGHSADSTVYEYFRKMADDARSAGYPIENKSSYRSYYDQRYIYNNNVSTYGVTKTDEFSARAGHSEHQTGFAIDIMIEGKEWVSENDETYTWLINNSYKYGFILRYPKDSTDLTGYSFEPWHYRYIGIDAATEVHNLGITFDEYYEVYVK